MRNGFALLLLFIVLIVPVDGEDKPEINKRFAPSFGQQFVTRIATNWVEDSQEKWYFDYPNGKERVDKLYPHGTYTALYDYEKKIQIQYNNSDHTCWVTDLLFSMEPFAWPWLIFYNSTV